MPAVNLAVVADSHLSIRAPEAIGNWDAVVAHVERTGPDLVVHLGDVSLDGAHDPTDLTVARELLDRLSGPWRAIPGNHDIGDNPWGSDATAIDDARLARWRSGFGDDHWSVDVGSWTVLGLDAQLFGSGLDADGDQWAWLEDTLDGLGPDRPLVLALHKPLAPSPDELAAAPPYRFAPEPARKRLGALLGRRRVGLVLNGHVHQHREITVGARRHVWAPTTWAVIPDHLQPVVGSKRCGLLTVTLHDDGEVDVVVEEPTGLRQLTLGDDLPSPYGH